MQKELINILKDWLKGFQGGESSLAGEKYSNLTIYDFRHNSACYWLQKYKNEAGLKFRFGWKKSEMIHYYTELLGMQDTITQEDLLTDVTKTELEKRLMKVEQERALEQEELISVKEELKFMKEKMKQVEEQTNELYKKLPDLLAKFI